jgi:gliding motility-associated-like protein
VKNARLLGKGVSVFYYLIIPVIIILGFGSRSDAQAPVANFTANIVSGCSPLIVQFTDQSAGNPTSWHWDLGNGSTSSIQHPTATYTTPGTYTIALTATNSNGSNTNTKTDYITVQVGPTAKFTSTDTAGCTPHTVTFTDLSTSNNGAITQWEWNFGDGGTSTQQNPTHIYTISGTFNVFLKVTNNSGCSQTIFKQQYIRAGAGAVADFLVNMPNYCQAPVNVSFTNNSQTDGPATYLWDFGDGGTSTAVNPSHAYTNYGSFTVTLTVQSADGCNSSKQQTINLTAKNVSFSGPSTICAGTAASFTMTSSPHPLSQTWNMGDGATYSDTSIVHTYTNASNYTITLTNEFPGGCIASTTQTINVTGGPSINFTADTTRACKPPFTVNFQASGAASGFTWDFGDGTTSNLQNPSHTYQAAGNFTVKLSATNSTGCVSSVEKAAFIKIQPPTLAITNLPVNDGCTPYSFSPVANINATEGVANYFWDFGNGFTSVSKEPGYTYTSPGTYSIKLRIETNGGCIDSIEYTNAVHINNGTDLDFTATPVSNCVDRPVQFNMTTAASPTSYMWYFGDNDSSALFNPVHSYKSTKKYNVTLVIKYGSCTSRLTKEEYVDITPPEARFSAVRDCNNKRLINFTNQSVGTGTILWDFGDGGTSNTANPSHAYAADGNYNVSLTIDNGTCSHTLTKPVEVSSAGIDIAADKTILCKNTPLTLKALVPNTVDAVKYEWTIVGSGSSTTLADSLNWEIRDAGVYTVNLKITTAGGCQEEVSKQDLITVYGPKADFISDKIGGCLNTTITFTDSSASDGIHPVTQWMWEFGDSATASGVVVSHSYQNRNKYSVTLTVTDNYGCIDKKIKSNFINITNGKAMFASADTMSCRGKNIVFRDTSSGTVSFWEWNFGDGAILNGVQNPAHIYTDSGYYTVKLKITENSGCSDSVTKVNYVTIKDPRAKFSLSDTFSTCPPLTVNFYDNSYYVKKWSWDFGDGGSSPVANPVNLYNIPNTYRVKLTVTSPGGCTDSAFASVKILGPYGQFTYSPLTGCTPFPVNYNVSSTEAVKFLWDYSDGIVDSGTVANTSHIYMSGGKFVPKVILTDASGCRVPVVGTDTIYLEKTVVDFSADSLSFCDSGTVVFSNHSIVNAPAANYEWMFGDGNSANTRETDHLYSLPGWYDVILKATTPLGCVDSLKKVAYVRINNSPVAAIISADSLCRPASFAFSAQLQPDTSGIRTWRWNFGNGQESTLRDPASQVFPDEGSYGNTLFVEDNQGCTTTVSKTVVVHPLPVVQAMQNTMICRGDSAQLSASGAISYTWADPDNYLSCKDCANPVASPAYNAWFKVEGKSAYGCAASDSVLVQVFQPYKVSVSPATDSICEGKGVTLKAYGAPLYNWSPAGGLSSTNISNPYASPSATTIYHVVGYDSLGCFKDSADIPVKVLANPIVNAGADIILSAGSTANIQCTGSPDIINYSWSPALGLSCTDCADPVVTGGSDMTYTVKVTNASGCTVQDQVKILVTCNEANVFVPNTFTPNADGMNDVFYIRGKGIFAIKSLKIFNRWGEMVFEKKNITANDPADGWNGLYKGSMASTDTYIYQLEVLCNNNQSLKYNGTISLIR